MAHHQNTTIHQAADCCRSRPHALHLDLNVFHCPSLPPPASFFNIQIGCFVWLNWRLIAHTIWRCLFKKTEAFFFSIVSQWLRLEIRHWRLLYTAFFVRPWRGSLDYTLTSSEAGGSHGGKPASYASPFSPSSISNRQSAHIQTLTSNRFL